MKIKYEKVNDRCEKNTSSFESKKNLTADKKIFDNW